MNSLPINPPNKKLLLTLILTLLLIPLTLSQSFSNPTPSFSGSTYRVYGSSSNPQFNNPSFLQSSDFTSPETYWPKYNQGDCLERQDFIMQIAPGGCSPSVVTSDLLEEQNVPVFCKVQAIQVNPLIDITKIRALRFKGDYPEGVSSISYFPARAAIRSTNRLISSPLKDNLGYVVIVLSRTQAEVQMPEFIEGTITATIDYDAEGAYGIGTNNIYTTELTDEEWARDYKEYSFWNGKAYVRAESIEQIPTTENYYNDQATISIYQDIDTKKSTITLRKGETSPDIYLSGFYCAAGMNIRLDDIRTPVETALIQVTDNKNTKQIWVARGDRILNGDCWVQDLDAYAGGGRVSINCRTTNGRFELSLTPGKTNLEVDNEIKEYTIGQKIKQNIFLAYAGQDTDETEFIVLINDTFSESEQGFAEREAYSVIEEIMQDNPLLNQELREKIQSAIKNQYKRNLRQTSSNLIDEKIQVKILTTQESEYNIKIDSIHIAKNKNWNSEDIESKQYYEESIRYYEELADLYPSEKSIQGEDTYAALGLYEAAQLAKKFNQDEKAQELYTRLLREHPNEPIATQTRFENQLITRYDTTQSKAAVYINNQAYFFDLLDLKKPSKEHANAAFLIDGQEIQIGIDDTETINERITIQLKEINDEYVMINYASSEENIFGTQSKSKRIQLNEQTIIDKTSIKLLNINLKKQVRLSIIPKRFGPRTESNFSFKIGIEKRAIQLTPEKTNEMINNLQTNMNKWSEVNNKLGKVVKGLKGACFATATTLTIKNLAEGFSGKAMARTKLMTAPGGWNEFCENIVSSGESSTITGQPYTSVQNCLLKHNTNINKDIELYEAQIENTNKEIEAIQKNIKIEKSDILDFQGQVDSKKLEDEFTKKFSQFCQNNDLSITLPDKDKSTTSLSQDVCTWTTMTHDQKRELLTLINTKQTNLGSQVLQQTLDNEIGKITLDAKNYWDHYGAELNAEKEAQDYGLKATRLEGEKTALAEIYNVRAGDKISSTIPEIKPTDKVVRIFSPSSAPNNPEYKAESEIADRYAIIKLTKEKTTNNYAIDKIYSLTGQTSDPITKDVKEYLATQQITNFRPANTEAYENPMLHPEKLNVKYFERTPYKGLPSQVPFDTEKGWYVQMTYILSGFGKPYDDSGRVVNYYICNVGPNGLIEFKKSADDICRYYNGNTADLNFPGMSLSESRMLINRAQQAISEAGRQYEQKTVRIGQNTFGSAISFEGEEGRCSNFMSPQDCHLLFNVCDPVICPSSRCDLGGDFRVDNVIQTGIIGSLMLCLPNLKEGILMPVCLTGVHAGIDGYLSILNSTQACLQESLETGRNIGVCDEIKSIYICEFFWKQATPFINVIIPRIIESFFSQGARGGGEYLTVQSAWDNTQSAIDFFKNEYATNSMQAFTTRSTEEVGSEVCKSFNSINYPSSGQFFDNLLEPDSPVQYHAWFSEDILTTATIPSTSHYKVYYHVYSGKDQGAYYAVYLKDLPESNYIHSSTTYMVDSGYIAKGTQLDEARDFTAVSGYKQLCISVNGQEECGFGKISTSYFLNSLTDAYASEQIKTEIKSEKECIAGTPSAYSLLQPNLQSGIEEVINPEPYNHGIIRVCSTENPGKQVTLTGEYDQTATTYDKWKEVGYCDDQTIKCWIDTTSVKNVIQDKGIEEQEIKNIDLAVLEEEIWNEETSRATASEIETQIKQLTKYDQSTINSITSKISKLINLAISNQYRARGIFSFGNLYRKLAEISSKQTTIINQESQTQSETTNTPSTETNSETTTETQTQELTLEQQATQNPENFIYKIFSEDRYFFYQYNKDNENWQWATSRTESTPNSFTENQDYLTLSPSEGLEKIKREYKGIEYIGK